MSCGGGTLPEPCDNRVQQSLDAIIASIKEKLLPHGLNPPVAVSHAGAITLPGGSCDLLAIWADEVTFVYSGGCALALKLEITIQYTTCFPNQLVGIAPGGATIATAEQQEANGTYGMWLLGLLVDALAKYGCEKFKITKALPVPTASGCGGWTIKGTLRI